MSKKTFSYNESLAELETIIRNIEEEKYSIDELSAQVKRASVLLSLCRDKLRETGQDVEDILKKMEE